VLANVLYAIGEYGRAANQYTKARHFAIEAHDISMQSAVLYNVAAFHIARISLEAAFSQSVADDIDLAELELNSVANLDSGIGIDSLGAMVPTLRAQLLLAKRDWEQADMFYSRALPDAVTYGPSRWESRFLAEQSHCHAMLGKRASARALASKAIDQLTARIEIDDVAACHARVASCLAVLGDRVGAETHLKVGKQCLAQFATRQSMQREKIGPLIPSIEE
jgi:tetratricopeptide (TPR) repeat protein